MPASGYALPHNVSTVPVIIGELDPIYTTLCNQKFRDPSAINLDPKTGAGRDFNPADLLADGLSQDCHPHRVFGLIELEKWSDRIETRWIIRQGREQLPRSRQGDTCSPHMGG